MTDKTIQDQTTEEVKPETKEEKKSYSDEEVQDIIKARLRQQNKLHEQKVAEYEAKMADLETAKNNPQPTAQPAAGGQPMTGAPGATAQPASMPHQPVAQPENESIPMEMLPYIFEQKKKEFEFNKKIDDAASKDEEFKKLLTNAPYPIAAPIVANMYHLDNAPAVAKHLMKDPKDAAALQAAAQTGQLALVQFLNEVSNKLEAKASKPETPKFTPAADLSDVGDSAQDFDIADYVKGKR